LEELGVEKAGEGLSDRLVEGTLKFGGGFFDVWAACCGMEWDNHARLMGGWMGTFMSAFWMKTPSQP